MPLSATYLASGGLLVEGDLVSLSTGILLEGNRLTDCAAGVGHLLHPRAAQAVARLVAGGVRAEDWLASAGNSLLSEERKEILAFLNAIAGLAVMRGWGGQLGMLRERFLALRFGAFPAILSRRWPATWRGLAAACVGGVAIFAAVSVPVAWLCVEAAMISAAQAWQLLAFVPAVLYAGTWAHEAVHLLLLGSSCAVVQRGLRLGVMGGSRHGSRRVLSAVCGPLCGVLVSLSAGFLSGSALLMGAACLLAALHGLSLLPTLGDGKDILRSLRTSR